MSPESGVRSPKCDLGPLRPQIDAIIARYDQRRAALLPVGTSNCMRS